VTDGDERGQAVVTCTPQRHDGVGWTERQEPTAPSHCKTLGCPDENLLLCERSTYRVPWLGFDPLRFVLTSNGQRWLPPPFPHQGFTLLAKIASKRPP